MEKNVRDRSSYTQSTIMNSELMGGRWSMSVVNKIIPDTACLLL